MEKQTIKKSIMLGIPIHIPDYRFLASLPVFLNEIKDDYDIQCLTVPGLALVDAQNKIADFFLNDTNCDYLLILEDDHWGHKKEMLDKMVGFDKEVVAINYYSRHFPYVNCLMRNLYMDNPDARFGGLFHTEGFHKVDMAGYAMMLIKRSVFSKLAKPYFHINIGGELTYATDIYFSDKLTEAGIEIWGCFDYILPHRDITKESKPVLLEKGFKEYRAKQVGEMLQRRK